MIFIFWFGISVDRNIYLTSFQIIRLTYRYIVIIEYIRIDLWTSLSRKTLYSCCSSTYSPTTTHSGGRLRKDYFRPTASCLTMSLASTSSSFPTKSYSSKILRLPRPSWTSNTSSSSSSKTCFRSSRLHPTPSSGPSFPRRCSRGSRMSYPGS